MQITIQILNIQITYHFNVDGFWYCQNGTRANAIAMSYINEQLLNT